VTYQSNEPDTLPGLYLILGQEQFEPIQFFSIEKFASLGGFRLIFLFSDIFTLFAAINQQYFSLTSNQHRPPASNTFLSQQISTSHQPHHSEPSVSDFVIE